LLKVIQTDGSLKVSDGTAGALLGGVDADGRFRIGAERTAPDRDILRVLWEGRFEGRSVVFARRTAVLRGEDFLNTTELDRNSAANPLRSLKSCSGCGSFVLSILEVTTGGCALS
jgi:hypothetical protein